VADDYLPKQALVTGGSGFIGAHVVRILLEQGVRVRVLKMPADSAPNLTPFLKSIEVMDGDLLDAETVERAIDGCDTLFHLAAIYAQWLPKPRFMFDVNVAGTRTVMAAALRAGVERVVHTSSIAAVGVRPTTLLSDEDTQFVDWYANDYVMSKYLSELEVQRFVAMGLPAVIVNPAFPFGEGDSGPTPTGNTIVMLLKGYPFYPAGGLNAVGVRDVAMGHWLAARRGTVGRRYILGNENLTYEDFAHRVARAADVRPARFRLGLRSLQLLGRLGDFVSDHITRRPPLVAERIVTYSVGRHLYFDMTRARAELGYDPEPIDGPIERAVAWFRKEGFV
jgi:dihydroflavonol-4-reductase